MPKVIKESIVDWKDMSYLMELNNNINTYIIIITIKKTISKIYSLFDGVLGMYLKELL
jgi:hypothetical protein